MNNYLRAISTNFIFFSISLLFFLAITPLSLSVMGEEYYGLWVVLIALMLFSNIGNLGIDIIVMKFSSEAQDSGNAQVRYSSIITAGFLIAFGMSIVTASALVITRNLIASNVNIAADLKWQFSQALLWIAVSICPQFLSRVPHGLLLSQLHNREVRRIELFYSISLWMGAIIIALIHKNIVFMAIWCLINNCLVFGLYYRSSRRLMPYYFQIDMPTLDKMFRFSKYMFLESFAITMFQHFDKVIVGFTLGPATAGAYSIGTSMALRLSMITGQATEVMIPYASLQESLNDCQKLFVIFRQLSRYVSMILAGISSLLIIWMQDLLSIWISPDYAARYSNGFRILVVAYGWISLCRSAHQSLTGTGKIKFTALVYFVSTTSMLVGLFFLSRDFGFLGAAYSNLIMTFLLIYNIYLYFTYETTSQWRHLFADLRWGLFIPLLFYCCSLLQFRSLLIFKLMEMVSLGILLSLAITKEDVIFVKTKLLSIKQLASRPSV